MRVGILTFHRAYNYGAVLQCYALQQVLAAMGNEVMVIDYRQPWIEEGYKAFSWSTLIKKRGLHMKLRYLRWAPKRWWNNERLQKPHFRGFCKHYLNLTKPCTADTIPADFDCYIIGSDQLWNMGCTANKPDKAYFGLFDHPQQSFLVGYAIGAHPHSLVRLGSDYLTEAVGKFRYLSFREPSIAEQMARMTGRAFDSCIDPTLLTDAAMWHNLTNDKYSTRQYILAYGVRKPAGRPNYLRQKADEMARLTGWEVIDVSNMQLSVPDFLSLFRHARYVLAMSFHAVAFALIFRRPFNAICLNDGHDERYANLLRMIGADKQLVSLDFTPEPLPLDYKPIVDKLNEYRKLSIKFLHNALTDPHNPNHHA